MENQEIITDQDAFEASMDGTPIVPIVESIPEVPIEPLDDDTPVLPMDDITPLEDEEDKVETPQDVDKYLQEKYSDYGIKTGNDLDVFFQKQSAYEKQISELNAKLEDASKNASPFENDAQRKLFEFAKSFDGTNGKVLLEYEHLQSLDVNSMSAKAILKESYVQSNKAFGRDKAEEMFELNYEDTYDTAELDEYSDAKEIRKRTLKLEFDSVNAKEKLANTIQTFKPQAKTEVVTPQNQVLDLEVEKTLKGANELLSSFKTIDLMLDKTGTKKFTVGLSENQQNIVASEVRSYLSNKSNYDDKGQLLNGATPQSVANFIAKAGFTDIMLRKAYERGLHEKEMEYVQKNIPKAGKPMSSGSTAHQIATSEQDAFEMSLGN